MADLKVTLTEDLVVNEQQFGSTKDFIINDINEVFKRVVTCPAGHATTLATFAEFVRTSAGAIAVGDVRYVRLTNLDKSNTINVACVGASDNFQIVLQPLQSFSLGKIDDAILGEVDTTPAFTGFEDLASIQVKSSNNIDIEVFVASA